jgi:type 1 glutamine amidotransferase
VQLRFAVSVSAFALAAWGAAPQDAPAPEKPSAEDAAAKQALARKMQEKKMAEELLKVEAVLPDKPAAAPRKPRNLLVFSKCQGFGHDSIPLGARTFELLGRKTGAYEPVLSEDPQVFAPDKLKDFDAVLLNNVTGDFLPDEGQRKSLLDFVKGGKGLAGIHGATDAFAQWPDYGELIGGYFNGHPFSAVTVKLDDPASPINAAFKGQGFDLREEIYTFKDPYSRGKLRVLLSVDYEKSADARQRAEKMAQSDKWKPREDNDYALSWIREYGEGRVFYCAFGHAHAVFWNPAILQHYLAGIQYALGDLKADATPSARK